MEHFQNVGLERGCNNVLEKKSNEIFFVTLFWCGKCSIHHVETHEKVSNKQKCLFHI